MPEATSDYRARVIAATPCSMCGAGPGAPCYRLNEKGQLTTEPDADAQGTFYRPARALYIHDDRSALYDSATSTTPMLLTQDEHEAMRLTADLANLLTGKIVADGPTAREDRNEIITHIHTLQRMILAQAAGRAYPTRYRVLGQVTQP